MQAAAAAHRPALPVLAVPGRSWQRLGARAHSDLHLGGHCAHPPDRRRLCSGCSPNLPEALSPLLPRLRVLKLPYCAAPTAEMAGVFGRLGVAQHVCVAGCHGLGGSALAALAHPGSSLQSLDARRIGTVSSDTVPHHLAEPRIAHHCCLTEETLCQTRLTTIQCGSFAP